MDHLEGVEGKEQDAIAVRPSVKDPTDDWYGSGRPKQNSIRIGKSGQHARHQDYTDSEDD